MPSMQSMVEICPDKIVFSSPWPLSARDDHLYAYLVPTANSYNQHSDFSSDHEETVT